MATKEMRGFAAMDRDQQRAIARKGGLEAHRRGTAHQFSSAEARRAGRKGGLTVSRDRRHMAHIGRHGGQARSLRAAATVSRRVEAAVASPGTAAVPLSALARTV